MQAIGTSDVPSFGKVSEEPDTYVALLADNPTLFNKLPSRATRQSITKRGRASATTGAKRARPSESAESPGGKRARPSESAESPGGKRARPSESAESPEATQIPYSSIYRHTDVKKTTWKAGEYIRLNVRNNITEAAVPMKCQPRLGGEINVVFSGEPVGLVVNCPPELQKGGSRHTRRRRCRR